MKRFREYLAEERTVHTLYHVTPSVNVKKILKTGLIPNKAKNGFTYNRFGGKLSKKGYIYAFEELVDAVRWVFKSAWDINQMKDMSVLTILKFEDDKSGYIQDTHWESSGGRGRWLMKEGTIPPEDITVLPTVDKRLGRLLTGLDVPEMTEEDLYHPPE